MAALAEIVSCLCEVDAFIVSRSCASFEIDFQRLGHPVRRCETRDAQQQRPSARVCACDERAGRRRQHRRQDGQRAAAGARAARLGADRSPPAEASLGPALFSETPRGDRRRCQARHHIPQGSWYPQ